LPTPTGTAAKRLDQRHFVVDANLAGSVVFWNVVTSKGHFLFFGHEVVKSQFFDFVVMLKSISEIGTPATTCRSSGTVSVSLYAHLPLIFLILPGTGSCTTAGLVSSVKTKILSAPPLTRVNLALVLTVSAHALAEPVPVIEPFGHWS